MKPKPPALTSLPPSPADDRSQRMVRYTIAMGIRMVCLVLMVVLPGWWKVAPALGAVLLPAIAVVIANVGSSTSYADRTPVAPLALEGSGPAAAASAAPSAEETSPGESTSDARIPGEPDEADR